MFVGCEVAAAPATIMHTLSKVERRMVFDVVVLRSAQIRSSAQVGEEEQKGGAHEEDGGLFLERRPPYFRGRGCHYVCRLVSSAVSWPCGRGQSGLM